MSCVVRNVHLRYPSAELKSSHKVCSASDCCLALKLSFTPIRTQASFSSTSSACLYLLLPSFPVQEQRPQMTIYFLKGPVSSVRKYPYKHQGPLMDFSTIFARPTRKAEIKTLGKSASSAPIPSNKAGTTAFKFKGKNMAGMFRN